LSHKTIWVFTRPNQVLIPTLLVVVDPSVLDHKVDGWSDGEVAEHGSEVGEDVRVLGHRELLVEPNLDFRDHHDRDTDPAEEGNEDEDSNGEGKEGGGVDVLEYFEYQTVFMLRRLYFFPLNAVCNAKWKVVV
jgi:hypothetical protein